MAKQVKKNNKDSYTSRYRVNGDIRHDGNVRIVGEGINTSVVPIEEARRIAESLDMDLVEMKSGMDIPVLKVCKFEKMVYELRKLEKKNKNSQKPLKEVQLSVSISKHDLETKANNARKFLDEGSKVKVVLSMRGRELIRREENKKSIFMFIDMLSDCAVAESMPRDEGNRTTVILKNKK